MGNKPRHPKQPVIEVGMPPPAELDTEDARGDPVGIDSARSRSSSRARISPRGRQSAQRQIATANYQRLQVAIGSKDWSIARLRILELATWLDTNGQDTYGTGDLSSASCDLCGSIATRACSTCGKCVCLACAVPSDWLVQTLRTCRACADQEQKEKLVALMPTAAAEHPPEPGHPGRPPGRGRSPSRMPKEHRQRSKLSESDAMWIEMWEWQRREAAATARVHAEEASPSRSGAARAASV